MRLDLISPKPIMHDFHLTPKTEEKREHDRSFQDMLKDAIYQINDLQIHSEKISQMLVKGQVENLHDVVIAAEKARLGLDLAVTVSNKLVQGYQELSRMQL